MSVSKKRNCMVFEAPPELTDRARIFAEEKMVSTSAVCRQALNEFLPAYHYAMDNKDIPSY